MKTDRIYIDQTLGTVDLEDLIYIEPVMVSTESVPFFVMYFKSRPKKIVKDSSPTVVRGLYNTLSNIWRDYHRGE